MFIKVRLCIVLALAGIPPEAPYHVRSAAEIPVVCMTRTLMLSCRHFRLGDIMAHKPHHHDHVHTHPLSSGPTRRDFLSSLIATAVLAPWVMGQQEAQSPSEIAERFRRMSE